MTLLSFVPRGRFGYWEKRFAPRPLLRDAVGPVHYLNCPDLGTVPGFLRQPAYTILVDLFQTPEQLQSAFRANTRNEIGRAAREGTTVRVNSEYQTFFTMYEAAKRYKPLPDTSPLFFDSFGSSLTITEASLDGEPLVTHVYIVDSTVARVRLIRSASAFRDFDKILQQKVGRANRFLHYRDMLLFQERGLRWYDLGGYIHPSPDVSPAIRNVSAFKQSFGGSIVQEANYLSWAQHGYRVVRRALLGTSGSRHHASTQMDDSEE